MNKEEFKTNKSFKIRPEYGYGKFYLDKINDDYDMSLQALIHYILYEEGIYQKILNEKDFKSLKRMIKKNPELVYYGPEDDIIQTTLREIYGECIKYTGAYLIEQGFDVVAETFKDYLDY